MTSFVAIDYETANSDKRSACSLGISIVENGKVIQAFEHLIKPPEEFSEFDPFNVMIHGIQAKDVTNAKSFQEAWSSVISASNDYKLPIVCHYSGFDIRVTQNLLSYFNQDFPEIRFYDTLTIAKKMWPALINHKLNTLSENFNIQLNHHNAASDAEACARIALKQIETSEKSTLEEVAREYGYELGVLDKSSVKTMSDFKNYKSSNFTAYDPKASSSTTVLPDREVNTGSDLCGTNLVFTGELISMSRREAIQLAVNNGAQVASGVSKKTNYLIVGISDFIDFSHGKKTRKLLDAEKLSEAGIEISILDEEEFIRMSSF
jgi:DNA polymerase-3 subunit epsilon